MQAIDRLFRGQDLRTARDHPAWLTTLVVAAALTVAACGGGPARLSATARSDTSAAATIGASLSAATSGTAPNEAPPSSGQGLRSFRLSGLVQRLTSLDSYRITVAIDGTPTYQAIVIMKPEKAEAITLGAGIDTTRVIRMGDRRWLATGDGAYEEVPPSMVDRLVDSFDPINLFGAFASGEVGAVATNLGHEQKNGISTQHYRIDSTSSMAGPFSALPAGAAIDVWVADDGYLVAYSLTGVSTPASIDISGVDDPTNKVVRPG